MAPIPIPMIMYQKTPLIIKNASLKIEGKRFEKVSFSSSKSPSFSAFTKTVIDYFIKTPEETTIFTNVFEINLKLLEKDFYENQHVPAQQSTGN